MNETKVAFAERKIHFLKGILYHYMEDYGYKYFHNLSEFVTTLISRRKCSIDLMTKSIMKPDFLSILYSKRLGDYKKPMFKIVEIVRFSEYDLHFRKGYKPLLL